MKELSKLVLLAAAALCCAPSAVFAGCGGDGENPCQPAEATYHRKWGCTGSTFDGLDGKCYKCPKDYKHHGIYNVKDENCCQKAATYKYKGGDTMSCAKTGGFGPSVKTGKCYKCPSGWKHDAGEAAHSKKVCYKKSGPWKEKPSYDHPHGCEKPQFHDPRKGGECWSCPSSHNRGVTAVTAKDACVPKRRCDEGHHEIDGKCYKKGVCGKLDQRPCLLIERIPSCDANLYENFGKNKCLKVPPGKTPFTAGLDSLADELKKVGAKCQDMLAVIPTAPVGPLGQNALLADQCRAWAGQGYTCGVFPYMANILTSLAGAGNIGKDMVKDIEAAYDKAPCKSVKNLVERHSCSIVHGLTAGATRSYTCVDKIIAKLSSESGNKGGLKSMAKPGCTFIGEFAFSSQMDSIIAGIPAGQKKQKMVKVLQYISAALSVAEKGKDQFSDIQECQGAF